MKKYVKVEKRELNVHSLFALISTSLTLCSHDVYDQVVPRRLKSASVVGSNLQHTGESLSPDQCSLYGSSSLGRAELDTPYKRSTIGDSV